MGSPGLSPADQHRRRSVLSPGQTPGAVAAATAAVAQPAAPKLFNFGRMGSPITAARQGQQSVVQPLRPRHPVGQPQEGKYTPHDGRPPADLFQRSSQSPLQPSSSSPAARKTSLIEPSEEAKFLRGLPVRLGARVYHKAFFP